MATDTFSHVTRNRLESKNSPGITRFRRTLLAIGGAAIASIAGGCHDDIKRIGEPQITFGASPTATANGETDAASSDVDGSFFIDRGTLEDFGGEDDTSDGSTENEDPGVVEDTEGGDTEEPPTDEGKDEDDADGAFADAYDSQILGDTGDDGEGTPDQRAGTPDEETPPADEGTTGDTGTNDDPGTPPTDGETPADPGTVPDAGIPDDTSSVEDSGTPPEDGGTTTPDEEVPPAEDGATGDTGQPPVEDTAPPKDIGTNAETNECLPEGSFKGCIADHPDPQKPAGCKVEGTKTCEVQADGLLKYGECEPIPKEVANPDEQCNYIDDNCNGSTDEGFNVNGNPVITGCTTQVPDNEGVNYTCPGVVICASETEATCVPITDPGQAEICDFIDNDCDKFVDEYCIITIEDEIPCNTGNPGICSQGEMDKFCFSDNVCIVQPECKEGVKKTTEICNGIDEDCDEKIDNGFNPGQECTKVCGAYTTYQCTPDGKGTACVAEKDASGQTILLNYEMCDAGDENCNGKDEKTEPCQKDTDGDGWLDDQEKSPCGDDGIKDPNVCPDCSEICDGKSNSCNGGPIDKTASGEYVCETENAAPNGCFDGKDTDGDGKTDTNDPDCQ